MNKVAQDFLGHKPGPKRNYVRTDEVVRQIIRHRFLDPDATLDILAQKLRQAGFPVSTRSVKKCPSSRTMAFKKKLHRYRPKPEPPMETQITKARTKPVPCDPRSIEYGVLDNFSPIRSWETWPACGCSAPELLRLGAWDLVCDWTGKRPECVQPRLAWQLVHEAAALRHGLRLRRGLNPPIFAVANGLPFLATDMAIHELLADRTVLDSQRLQVALGKGSAAPRAIFRDGFWPSILIAYAVSANASMRRHRSDQALRPTKTAQTFFVLDADTHQPVCFTTGTSEHAQHPTPPKNYLV